ncbi:hypothetical protein NDU88_005808 [Pleurodeles waltl]|uniref:Uncharacterized protein n=1 Tax=Pleurodeles waltl TaxID=8319 RepID=A0AAV7QJB1_PLEWA|nr:hypothetical protein NDU88_005808 [Pleurodeles waltl]
MPHRPLAAAVWDGTDNQQHRRGTPLNNTTRCCCCCHSARRDLGGPEDALGGPRTAGEPSRVERFAAIQGSRVALEGKIGTVAVEVNLLRMDLRRVSEKVKVVEGSIVELQAEVGSLRKQIVQVKAKLRAIKVRYMLLYLAHLKLISGRKAHFFNRPSGGLEMDGALGQSCAWQDGEDWFDCSLPFGPG